MPTIGTEEWLAELDRVASFGDRGNLVDDRGFTNVDLVKHKGMSRSTAERVLREQVKAGIIKEIGIRSTKGRAKVYEIIIDTSEKV